MLYLVGGAARSGKSTIARQFMLETGTPYFCLDYLMMGFANGLPGSGVDPEDDELHIGALLWPVVQAMAIALLENEEDYLFEGVQLCPVHVGKLVDAFPGQVRACFVGFASVDVRQKAAELRQYGGGLDDWLRDYTEERFIEEVERLKDLSARIEAECESCGLRYVEISDDLHETVGLVVDCLLALT
ncbi:MAG: adenylate kinase [Chloroflexi bacterium]|nr:adenylate kinase [Chloroflexota bacterium]